MNKQFLCLVLCLGMLLGILGGCGLPGGTESVPGTTGTAPTVPTTQETEPPATLPADGNPDDVTCRGTYTRGVDLSAVVATVRYEIVTVPETVPAETTEDGETVPTEPPQPQIAVVEQKLTNGLLQAYYWAAVESYRQAGYAQGPDFDKPLDSQVCTVDSSVNSWQQYFLNQAVEAWHGAAALKVQGQVEGLPAEEAWQPNVEMHEEYMTGMPAVKYLYQEYPYYIPNTMHQAYLDSIPTLLEELAAERGYASADKLAWGAFATTLDYMQEFVRDYNWGYMYFVTMADYLAYTEADVRAELAANPDLYAGESGYTVDIRHLLVVPGTDTTDAWGHKIDPYKIAKEKAKQLQGDWLWRSRVKNEASFAEIARNNSQDTGSALDGGGYQNLRPGQLMEELDAWCFDPARKANDTTIIETDMGFHVLYFAGKTDNSYALAEDNLRTRLQQEFIEKARSTYPAVIDYSAIALGSARPSVSLSDVLYPDVAHERYPEVPLYLQRDYPNTSYGGYPLTSHGCGITTLAMLASYMSDTELTPAALAARYGHYCHENGTDGMIFQYEAATLGFYFKDKDYNGNPAREALAQGCLVVNVQHKGYWTGGGHYLVLEKLNEDGTVQIRDSNILNYKRVSGHKEDKHEWSTLTGACDGFWIYYPKITRIPACARCGDESQQLDGLLSGEYLCRKCLPAMLRRDSYLTAN